MAKLFKITIVLRTSSSSEDVNAVLSLLDEGTEYSIVAERIDNGTHVRRPIQTPAEKYKDLRIVWDEENNRINVTKSLANLGMTRASILNTPTKRGTAEYAVKRALGYEAKR